MLLDSSPRPSWLGTEDGDTEGEDYIYSYFISSIDGTELSVNVTQFPLHSFDGLSNPESKLPKSKEVKRHFIDIVIFLICALISLLINLRVCYILTIGTKRKLRSVNILVVHLSSVAICFTFLILFYIMEKYTVIKLMSPGICELLSLLRNGIYSVFPLNAAGIIYERIRSFKITLGKLLVFRTIVLIWIVALLGSLPSIFMVKYEKDPLTNLEKCKQILLFGAFEATLAYEIFRFLLYHFLVCLYIAFALFKIRSKIKYLYILKPIPNERMRRKVQRVRFVYIHSIIFILIWLPNGFLLCLYKTLSRYVGEIVKNYLTLLVLLNNLIFILSPLIYVFLHEDMSKVNFVGFAICSRSMNSTLESEKREIDTTCNMETGMLETQSQSKCNNHEKEVCKQDEDLGKIPQGEAVEDGERCNKANEKMVNVGAEITVTESHTCVPTMAVTAASHVSLGFTQLNQENQKASFHHFQSDFISKQGKPRQAVQVHFEQNVDKGDGAAFSAIGETFV